jgi:predicted aspartyl protease
MDIQNLPTSASVSAATIIGEKNKKAGLSKWREPQKRILKKKVEKEAKLATPKTVRFGTFRDIEDEGDDIEMVDHVPALNGKTKSPEIVSEGRDDTVAIEREPSKKRWKLLDDLKGQEGESARKVFEQMLELEVGHVTVKDILTLSPAVQQKMFRSQAKELKPKVRSLDIIGSTRKKGMYAVSSPRAVVEVEGRVKVAALLDTGADVNVMTAEVADAANLPVLEITPLEAETFTGHNAQLLGICREVDVQIGAVCNSVNIFVVQEGAHPLLLGMPYWIQAGVTFDYSDDAVHATVVSDDAKLRARFKTLTPKNVEGWVERALVNVLN